MKAFPFSRMILPAILVIAFLIAALSIFTGSAYAQINQHKPAEESEKLELSDLFPNQIQKWKSLIEQSAHQYGVDPNLIGAVMLQESGGQAEVISSSGAVGLMQVMPRDGIASTFICEGQPCFSNRPTIESLLVPDFNIDYGVGMLSRLIAKKGSVLEALYHYGPYDVGYSYAEIVLNIYQKYK